MNLMEDIIQDRVLKFGKIEEINSKINLNIDLEKYIREFNRYLTRKDNVDKISLISVHSSKGLEWEVVFYSYDVRGDFSKQFKWGEFRRGEKAILYSL